MIWRLLASVLAISDTGGLSVTSESSNWPTEAQCIDVVRNFYTVPPPQDINGHRVVMKVSATCLPVDFSAAAASTANSGDCGLAFGGRVPLPGCLPPGVGPPYGRNGGPPYTR